MNDSESSAQSIIRHEARERDFELAHGDDANIEEISNHIEKHIGKVDMVYHDVHLVLNRCNTILNISTRFKYKTTLNHLKTI